MALQNLPVRFALDRAGLVGADGPTHAGAFDIAFLACLPNMVVMAAADESELVHMVATAAAHDHGPIAVRFPRGEGIGIEVPERGQVLPIGKGRMVREGSKIALLSLGTRFGALVLDHLNETGAIGRGLKVKVMTLPDRFIDHDKPEKMYAAAALDAKAIVEKALDLLGRDHAASPIRA